MLALPRPASLYVRAVTVRVLAQELAICEVVAARTAARTAHGARHPAHGPTAEAVEAVDLLGSPRGVIAHELVLLSRGGGRGGGRGAAPLAEAAPAAAEEGVAEGAAPLSTLVNQLQL